jgi:hypothetical protein
VSCHMNASAAELHDVIPSEITLPLDTQEGVKYLIAHHGSFVPVASIPAASDDDRAKLVLALATAGLIKPRE